MTNIDLKYPKEKIQKSRSRLKSVFENRQYIDRMPVQICLQTNYFLDSRGFGFLEYFHDAKTQVYHQIMNIKWRLENIEEDFFTGDVITLSPDYQNIATAANFNGVEVIWDDVNPPLIRRFIHSINDLRRLGLPEPTDGVCGQKIQLLKEMREEIKNYRVTLNGEPIGVKISSPGVEGPFTDALDLIGEELFVWLYEYPDDMKWFFDLLSTTLIRFEKTIRPLCDYKRKGISITADGAEMLSPKMFIEFVLPFCVKIFNEFPEYKEFHMCGKINHLIDIVSEMNIDHFIAFGFPADIKAIKEKIYKNFVYSGGVNPVLLKDGSKTEIVDEIKKYINMFKDTGSYILGDGASVAPGTPPENINLFAETAEKIMVNSRV